MHGYWLQCNQYHLHFRNCTLCVHYALCNVQCARCKVQWAVCNGQWERGWELGAGRLRSVEKKSLGKWNYSEHPFVPELISTSTRPLTLIDGPKYLGKSKVQEKSQCFVSLALTRSKSCSRLKYVFKVWLSIFTSVSLSKLVVGYILCRLSSHKCCPYPIWLGSTLDPIAHGA